MNDQKRFNKTAIKRADEELLASLGYKQEFHRAFTPLEVRTSESDTLSLFFELMFHRLSGSHSVS